MIRGIPDDCGEGATSFSEVLSVRLAGAPST